MPINKVHPDTANSKIQPAEDDVMNTESSDNQVRFDICLTGHEEASRLLDWLETQLTSHIKSPFTCTRDVHACSAAYIIALTPNSWSCPDILTALAAVNKDGKRIGLVYLPLYEGGYLYSSDVVDVGNVDEVRVDLGALMNADIVNEFASLFTHYEVLSLRRESWAAASVVKHLIEIVGLGRRYINQHRSFASPARFNDDELSDCVFEGQAFDKTSRAVLGSYQIIARFDSASGRALFEVDYLCQSSSSIESFECKHQMQWSSAEGALCQSDEESTSWYSDERWKCNTDRIMSRCVGQYDPLSKTLMLVNRYYNSRAELVEEVASLQKMTFTHHMCVLGVKDEIEETAEVFATIAHSKAQLSRKPRVRVVCDRASGEQDEETVSTVVSNAGVVIVFVTDGAWADPLIAEGVNTANEAGKKIILISQPDPRLQGHCIVPEIMKSAPLYLQNNDVLPFYRRNYEQNAFLAHLFKVSNFAEAIVDESPANSLALGSADPAVTDMQLFSRLDAWTETSALQLLQSGNWRYYEGVAGRGEHIWGWYQIDCLTNDRRGEMVMRVHYQSRNPGSVPSYLTITDFDWNPEHSSFTQANGGSWHGTRNEGDFNLSITNKFGDTITHTAMPFVHHFFLSHIQREATDMCAYVCSELRNVTKIGAKSRCWFDQKASQINRDGMYAGVMHSGAFVLFLTPSIFKSAYVMFELHTAKRKHKPIILLHNTDRTSVSYVDIHELMSEAPPEHRDLLNECRACLEYATDGDDGIAFMYRLLEAGGYLSDMEEDKQVLGQSLCAS